MELYGTAVLLRFVRGRRECTGQESSPKHFGCNMKLLSRSQAVYQDMASFRIVAIWDSYGFMLNLAVGPWPVHLFPEASSCIFGTTELNNERAFWTLRRAS